ncbi:hypothetical protein [Moorena producens]|uniref:hypothetical protein n=1 Tax=Moorena producens TaxID=1155739 RepID=UPI003C747607
MAYWPCDRVQPTNLQPTNLQPSTFNLQATNLQPLTFNLQPINLQLFIRCPSTSPLGQLKIRLLLWSCFWF